ncbi:hypothetical protein [Kitasatospora sp. NPDC098663]|uniref:hypothetical protein n=1 Tax=Kitasatospora sp. NPDC098663 TaxID=3364096 RepID=UPI0037F366B5
MNTIAQSLRGWTPDDQVSNQTFEFLTLAPELLEVVSSHRAGNQQFLVAFNWDSTSGPWPRTYGIHLSFEPDAHQCHARVRSAPTFGWAGHWLVERGADPRAVGEFLPVSDDPYNFGPGNKPQGLLFGDNYGFARPGGRPTRLIEDRVRRSGDRYRLLASEEAYSAYFNEEREANLVLLEDRDPRAAGRRFLIQLETIQLRTATYNIAEGGFRTMAQARHWIDQIDGRAGTVPPLPATDPVTGLSPSPVPAPVQTSGRAVQPAASPHRTR